MSFYHKPKFDRDRNPGAQYFTIRIMPPASVKTRGQLNQWWAGWYKQYRKDWVARCITQRRLRRRFWVEAQEY